MFLIISTFFFGILCGLFFLCLVLVSSTESLVSVYYCLLRIHSLLILHSRRQGLNGAPGALQIWPRALLVQYERVLYLHVRWCCASKHIDLRTILKILTYSRSKDRHHILHHILYLCLVNDGSQRWVEYIYGRIVNGMYDAHSELSITYRTF